MATEHQCEAFCVLPRGGHFRCPNNAKYEQDGKWYCGTHDPVRVKQRQDKRDAASREKQACKDAIWERRGLEREFCENMTDDELKAGIARKAVRDDVAGNDS